MTLTQPLTAPDAGLRLDATRFRRELARRGISAGTVAKAAGIAPNTVSRCLTGQAISIHTLRSIAKALHSLPVLEGVDELLVVGTNESATGSRLPAALMEDRSGAADLRT